MVYTFENPLRKHAKKVINFLKSINMTPSLLTGDGREAAEAIAERLNLVTNNIIIRADVGDN